MTNYTRCTRPRARRRKPPFGGSPGPQPVPWAQPSLAPNSPLPPPATASSGIQTAIHTPTAAPAAPHAGDRLSLAASVPLEVLDHDLPPAEWDHDSADEPPLPDPPAAHPIPKMSKKAPPPRMSKGAAPRSPLAQPEPTPARPDDPVVAASPTDAPPTDPVEALAWMNARHAVVQEGGKTLVLTETHDEGLDRRLFVRSSFNDFKNFYMNHHVTIPSGDRFRHEDLGRFWLKHPVRRQFTGVTFAPNRETPGLFNLWHGFGVAPALGDWSLMQAHLADNICARNADTLRWLVAWLADVVQHPDRPAEVAVALRGVRGTGKGMFGRACSRLVSPHFVHVSNPQHLLGKFNAHLQDAILVFADEAFLAGDRHAEGVLKMIITEPMIPIERKGRDVVMARNLIHLLIASNAQWVVPAGHDERRFAVLDVAAEHAQDHSYFAALARELQQGGLAAMLYDLLYHDCADVNLRQPPMTAALFDQKLHSLTPIERWWFDKLSSGCLLASVYTADERWPTAIARTDLQRDYLAAMDHLGARSDRGTETELGMRLRELLPAGFPLEIRRTLLGSDERPRLYGLPSLTNCRRHFQQKYRWPDIVWPASDGQPEESAGHPVDPGLAS